MLVSRRCQARTSATVAAVGALVISNALMLLYVAPYA